MDLLKILLVNSAVIAACMIGLWLLSLKLRDVGIVDMFWGFGFVVVAWATLIVGSDREPFHYLLVGMVSVWGLRLTVHLMKRNLGEPEDSRYQSMRRNVGPSFAWKSLFYVFGLQGVIMLFVALPIQVGLISTGEIAPWCLLGVAVWFIGLAFETVGDYQLARFKGDPSNKGRVLDQGLWRYTRHPNYFGDALVWWGLYLTIASRGDGWWTFVSPLVMTIFLVKISGVALLETTIEDRRPEYARYKKETSAFFPWPPKRLNGSKVGELDVSPVGEEVRG